MLKLNGKDVYLTEDELFAVTLAIADGSMSRSTLEKILRGRSV